MANDTCEKLLQALFCAGFVLMVLLLVFGGITLDNYIDTRDFIGTTCTVRNSSVCGFLKRECDCTRQGTCRTSIQPCLQILVIVDKTGNVSRLYEDLHETLEEQEEEDVIKMNYLHSQQRSIAGKQEFCLFTTKLCCDNDLAANNKTITEFAQEYGKSGNNRGNNFTCYYDQSRNSAFVNIQDIVTPIVLLTFGLILFLVYSICIVVLMLVIFRAK